MDKPIVILQKNSERESNKIRLPKFVVDKMGRNYFMEIYENKIVLKPIERS